MKIILLTILLNVSWVYAADVDTSYAAALVDKQMSGWELTQKALAAVVSKKSGQATNNVINQGLIDDSFKPIVLRSYYEQIPAEYDKKHIWFNVVVDEAQLKSLMLDRKIPIWPSRRGEVFIWMVEELESGELVNSTQASEAYYWLNKWLIEKGVPTNFYNFEAEDLLTFKTEDVRYLNPDLIDYVTETYDAAISLFVFVKHSRTGYSYRYGLVKNQQPTTIKNLKFVDLSTGLNTLAEDVQLSMSDGQQVFAEEFSQNTISVKVTNLVRPDEVLDLFNYLDNHALIDNYQASHFKNGQLDLAIEIKVLPDTFVKFVEKENVLTHLPLDLGNSILFSVVK